MADIVVTWPMKRPLDSYIEECDAAKAKGLVVCFRLSSRPRVRRGDRCYHVHGGFVRGWLEIIDYRRLSDVVDPLSGLQMGEGHYLVRKPEFHLVQPVKLRGFRGFRYANGLIPAEPPSPS